MRGRASGSDRSPWTGSLTFIQGRGRMVRLRPRRRAPGPGAVGGSARVAGSRSFALVVEGET